MSLLFWFDQLVHKKAGSSYLLSEMGGSGFFSEKNRKKARKKTKGIFFCKAKDSREAGDVFSRT